MLNCRLDGRGVVQSLRFVDFVKMLKIGDLSYIQSPCPSKNYSYYSSKIWMNECKKRLLFYWILKVFNSILKHTFARHCYNGVYEIMPTTAAVIPATCDMCSTASLNTLLLETGEINNGLTLSPQETPENSSYSLQFNSALRFTLLNCLYLQNAIYC